jgi:glycerate 2-kinase
MTLPTTLDEAHRLARELLAAAIAGADAGAASHRALEAEALPPGRIWMLAVGKAAPAMGTAAAAVLRARGREIAGGLIVGAEPAPRPSPTVAAITGDHPVPRRRSAAAAAALGAIVERVASGDVVLVLLSGGATALVGAPVAGVEEGELALLFERLLRSGADIGTMNAVRRRFLRWGGGRLAAALAPATVRCLAVSDVAGDDLTVIGSGPCVPDPTTAAALLAVTSRPPLAAVLTPALRAHLEAVARGVLPESPKAGDAAFAGARSTVILANRDALDAAAAAARRSGLPVTVADGELAGAAAAAGARCADALLHAPPGVLLWGGETTVALGEGAGRGGRSQELALAAARRLHERGAQRVVLLAAGTDGRDGPTDAAGAAVDALTWARCAAAGADPAAALALHDAYGVLDAAGALLRTGPTGTNVRDVVIGVAW